MESEKLTYTKTAPTRPGAYMFKNKFTPDPVKIMVDYGKGGILYGKCRVLGAYHPINEIKGEWAGPLKEGK